MPKITTKQDFIKQLEQYTKINISSNIIYEFNNNKIVIDETEEDGRGEIYLDISSHTEDIFFLKITHQSNHNIGTKHNHNDGIVLKVDLENKKIVVFLFELKKQLRFNKLKKAAIQLVSAYKFIKYLMLEECFHVEYNFFIVYEINNIHFDIGDIKQENKFEFELYKAIHEDKNVIPIQIPFCMFKTFSFKQVEFGSTIQI